MATSNIPHVEFLKNKKLAIEFEIISLEDLFSRAGKIVPPLKTPHRLRFHNILYITAGGGTHKIDFEPYPFNEGSLIFVSRGQVQAFDVRPGIKGYLLLFTTDFLEKNLIHSDVVSLYRFYNYHLHAPIIHAQKTREEGIHDLVKEIKREYCNPNHFLKEEILRHFLKVLMLKVERNKRTLTSDQKKAEWLVRFGIFNEHLEKHIARQEV